MSGSIDVFIEQVLAAAQSSEVIANDSNVTNASLADMRMSDQSGKESLEERVKRLEIQFETLLSVKAPQQNFVFSNTAQSHAKNSSDMTLSNNLEQNWEAPLAEVAEVLSQQNQDDVMEMFTTLQEELQRSRPRSGTVKGLWDQICVAAPAVKQLLDITRILGG